MHRERERKKDIFKIWPRSKTFKGVRTSFNKRQYVWFDKTLNLQNVVQENNVSMTYLYPCFREALIFVQPWKFMLSVTGHGFSGLKKIFHHSCLSQGWIICLSNRKPCHNETIRHRAILWDMAWWRETRRWILSPAKVTSLKQSYFLIRQVRYIVYFTNPPVVPSVSL